MLGSDHITFSIGLTCSEMDCRLYLGGRPLPRSFESSSRHALDCSVVPLAPYHARSAATDHWVYLHEIGVMVSVMPKLSVYAQDSVQLAIDFSMTCFARSAAPL